MPRKEINYSKTIIYKLVCNDPTITDIYVGHTTDFIRRKQHHKTRCNNENIRGSNSYVYKFIRENGGWYNWNMVQIELYSCNDTHEATARERYWLEQLGATLNTYIPSRTKKEWIETNIEHLTEYKKEWYEANKEQVTEYKKEWYEANKEIISEKAREHYEANKELISEKRKEIITCECGCIVCRAYLSTHRKSKKHLDNLNNLI
jgi:hypothetical protein